MFFAHFCAVTRRADLYNIGLVEQAQPYCYYFPIILDKGSMRWSKKGPNSHMMLFSRNFGLGLLALDSKLYSKASAYS
jgi:hypothetical protein